MATGSGADAAELIIREYRILLTHKWEIGVSAGNYYPSLTREFWGNDIGLAYEDDHLGLQFYAFSYHIDELDDPEKVAYRLFSLQLLLNGSLRIALNENFLAPIKFTHFAPCNGGRQFSVYASNIENNPFSLNPLIDLGQHPSIPAKGKFSSYILNICKKDEVLRSLVFHVGLISLNNPFEQIMTWGTLYKIYDSVKHHSRRNGYDFSSLADESRLKDFTAACNSSLLLGVYARHGDMGWDEPSSAITDIDKATALIIDLAHNFCTKYICEKYP